MKKVASKLQNWAAEIELLLALSLAASVPAAADVIICYRYCLPVTMLSFIPLFFPITPFFTLPYVLAYFKEMNTKNGYFWPVSQFIC